MHIMNHLLPLIAAAIVSANAAQTGSTPLQVVDASGHVVGILVPDPGNSARLELRPDPKSAQDAQLKSCEAAFHPIDPAAILGFTSSSDYVAPIDPCNPGITY